ncbi:hypothetical protein [Crossiella sp. NPDC003009]
MGRNPNQTPIPVQRRRPDTEPGDVRLVMECPYRCGVTVRSHVAEIVADVMGVHVYLWHEWQFADRHHRLPTVTPFT